MIVYMKHTSDPELTRFHQHAKKKYKLKPQARRRGNQIVVFTAPPGAGKTSVINAIIDLNTELNNIFASAALPRLALTYTPGVTTRAQRPGERSGFDFHFHTRPQFLDRLQRGDFLLSFISDPHFYAIDGSDIEKRLLNADPFTIHIYNLNAWQVPVFQRRFSTKPFVIFLNAPSIQELERRKFSRGGMSPAEIEFRRKTMRDEIAQGKRTAHIQIINRELGQAVNQSTRAILTKLFSRTGTPAATQRIIWRAYDTLMRKKRGLLNQQVR